MSCSMGNETASCTGSPCRPAGYRSLHSAHRSRTPAQSALLQSPVHPPPSPQHRSYLYLSRVANLKRARLTLSRPFIWPILFDGFGVVDRDYERADKIMKITKAVI